MRACPLFGAASHGPSVRAAGRVPVRRRAAPTGAKARSGVPGGVRAETGCPGAGAGRQGVLSTSRTVLRIFRAVGSETSSSTPRTPTNVQETVSPRLGDATHPAGRLERPPGRDVEGDAAPGVDHGLPAGHEGRGPVLGSRPGFPRGRGRRDGVHPGGPRVRLPVVSPAAEHQEPGDPGGRHHGGGRDDGDDLAPAATAGPGRCDRCSLGCCPFPCPCGGGPCWWCSPPGPLSVPHGTSPCAGPSNNSNIRAGISGPRDSPDRPDSPDARRTGRDLRTDRRVRPSRAPKSDLPFAAGAGPEWNCVQGTVVSGTAGGKDAP